MRSDIPQDVIEKPVHKRKETGSRHEYRIVDCYFKGHLVGQRVYDHAGIVVLETPMKNGLKHGREITRNEDGTLLLIEPYAAGKIHGTAKQYGCNGKVIGTYTMVHGTGLDIWRQENGDNTISISEVLGLQDGLPNGYEWRFVSAQQDLWHERHWHRGKLHGIERIWNSKGRLRRGYPKFYIADEVVSRRKYIKMTFKDKTLPAFREEDDAPYRKWPSEVSENMGASSD